MADRIARNLSRIFDGMAASPARKSAKSDEASSASAPRVCIGPCPFEPTHGEWMQKALAASLSVFSEEVTEKIVEVEQRACILESQMHTVQENMAKLQVAADKTGEVDLAALQKQVTTLQERMDHQRAPYRRFPFCSPTRSSTRVKPRDEQRSTSVDE